jgi:hypothetical protein
MQLLPDMDGVSHLAMRSPEAFLKPFLMTSSDFVRWLFQIHLQIDETMNISGNDAC